MARSEASRLRKNIRQKIYYYSKKGYNFDDTSFLYDMDEDELRDFTTEDLLKYADEDEEEPEQEQQYEDEDENEDEEDEQTEEEELLEEYGIFPDEVDMIIENFRDSYANFNSTATTYLERWLDRVIEERGKEATAVMIQEAREHGMEITNKVIYGDLVGFVSEFLYWLPAGFEMSAGEINDIMMSLEAQWDDNARWGF